jgi:rhodanese-related sulfurtransferase
MRALALSALLVTVLATSAYSHADITPQQAKDMLDAGTAVFLDVREELEYCSTYSEPPGHIPGAINMPWNSGYLEDHYGELSPDEDIVVVCQIGSRSNLAATFLDDHGFSSVYDMLGGMAAWDWETANCESVPLDLETWGALKALFK